MNRTKAQQLVGKLVVARTELWGDYVGELVEVVVKRGAPWRGRVKILAVASYPVQGLGDTRKFTSLRYGELKDFGGVNIEPYIGEIPDYASSLSSSLDAAIQHMESIVTRLEQENRADTLLKKWLEELREHKKEVIAWPDLRCVTQVARRKC